MTLVHKKTSPFATLLLLSIAMVVGCGEKTVAPHQFQGKTQGTYFLIIWYDSLNRDLNSDIFELLEQVEASVSVYRQNSLISKLNRNETDSVDEIFKHNFLLSKEVNLASNGAFDCTMGNLIEAWGWSFKQRDKITPEKVSDLLNKSGYDKVFIEDNKLKKIDSTITVNFNAIAKGHTCDIISSFFISLGITSFLIDIGGEFVVGETKPDGTPWSVGIEMPNDTVTLDGNLMDRPLKAIVKIAGNKGIATSGNYRRFYIEDGVKYSHTIDPSTGYPVTHSVLSATVVTSTAALADAWATAFMVVGLEGTKKLLIANPHLEAYLIYDDNGTLKTWMSGGMKKILKEI